MKFPKLYAVRIPLYYLVCILATPLFGQTITPTFESSFGSGNTIRVCPTAEITFMVSNVPSNAKFRFYRKAVGGMQQQISSDPASAQITTALHGLNDLFFAEVIYTINSVTSSTFTTSITIDYLPSPSSLALTTNLNGPFYCAGMPLEIMATGADIYEFYLDGIAQAASSTLDMITPNLIRGETLVTVIGYNLMGCSETATLSLQEVDLSPGTISGDQTIALDQLPATLMNETHAQLGTNTFDTNTMGLYQWQSSFDAVNWFDILNATAADFTPSLITTNTYFRRKASSRSLGNQCTVFSNEVLVELDLSIEFSCDHNPIVFNGKSSYTVDPCKGFSSITVSTTAITGGKPFVVNGAPTYALAWEYTAEDQAQPIRFSGYTIAQAFPGEYRLWITDANNCTLTDNEPLVFRVEDVTTEMFEVQGAFISPTGAPTKINYYACVTDPQNIGEIGLVVQGGAPPFDVNWSYRPNGVQSFQQLPQFTNQYILTNLAEGEYKVSITTANSNCLPTDVNNTHYNYEETFVLNAGLPQFTTPPSYPADLCQNGIGSVQIGVADLPNDATFFLEGRALHIEEVNQGIYTLRIETTLTQADLEIRAQSGCILASIPLDIEVEQPQFVYSSLSSAISTVIPVREEVNFINQTSGNYSHVIWYFGDGQKSEQLPRTDPRSNSIFHQYLLAGNYQVRLAIYNGMGCSRLSTQTISVGEGYHVLFPNAFTPNKDQINDVFRPILSGFSEVNFAVYDQRGTLLYLENKSDTTPPKGIFLDGWDGLNAPLPSTNFIYTLQGTLLDQTTEIQRTGTFTALK